MAVAGAPVRPLPFARYRHSLYRRRGLWDSEYDTTYTLPVLYSRLGIYGIAFERTSSS